MTARPRRRSVARSWKLLQSFRLEQRDPDRFYDLLSQDAVALLGERIPVDGVVAIDVGGGAGYLTRALRAGGARCLLVDDDIAELSWRGPPTEGSVLADARSLPLVSGSVDLVVSSNVLEHVAEPYEVIDEMARALRVDGHMWISFTNWYGPWGGHETSPWHYLGGDRARRHYASKAGHAPKNVFGESLFPLHVGEVLRYLSAHRLLDVVDARPRYLPEVARGLVRVPLVRELATWNLEVLARKRRLRPDLKGCRA